LRPPACPQICLKKGKTKPYGRNDYSVEVKSCVVWTPERPDMMYPEDLKELPKEVKEEFERTDWSGSPYPWLTDKEALKERILDRIMAKQIDPAFIGHHGCFGALTPELGSEEMDEQFLWFVEQASTKDLKANYKEKLIADEAAAEADRMEVDDDEEEEADGVNRDEFAILGAGFELPGGDGEGLEAYDQGEESEEGEEGDRTARRATLRMTTRTTGECKG
jgi:hypothetical protein